MKIIRKIDDIYKKIDHRLKYDDFIELANLAHREADKCAFSFNHYFYYRYLFKLLLKEYKDRGFITTIEYLAAVLVNKLDFYRIVLKFFLKRDKCFYLKVDNSFKKEYITFTLGKERLLPKGFENVLDLEFEYKKSNLGLATVCNIMTFAIKNGVAPSLYEQYLITKDDIVKLDIKDSIVIIEECMDFHRQIFTDLVQLKAKVIIGQRGIPYLPLYFYKNEVICNNSLAYKSLSSLNNIITYGKNYLPINQIYRTRNKVYGYLPDIGDFIINLKDKYIMDNFISNFAKKKI